MAVEGSKFTMTDAPALAPGADFITKTSVGPFVDTGYDVPFEEWRAGSRIYLAVSTVREIADVAGLFDTEPSTEAEEAYRRGFADGLEQIMGAEDVVNAVDRLGYIADLIAQYGRGSGSSADGEVAAPAGGEADGGAEAPESKQPRAARTARQNGSSARKSGHTGVPADSSDGSLLGV